MKVQSVLLASCVGLALAVPEMHVHGDNQVPSESSHPDPSGHLNEAQKHARQAAIDSKRKVSQNVQHAAHHTAEVTEDAAHRTGNLARDAYQSTVDTGAAVAGETGKFGSGIIKSTGGYLGRKVAGATSYVFGGLTEASAGGTAVLNHITEKTLTASKKAAITEEEGKLQLDEQLLATKRGVNNLVESGKEFAHEQAERAREYADRRATEAQEKEVQAAEEARRKADEVLANAHQKTEDLKNAAKAKADGFQERVDYLNSQAQESMDHTGNKIDERKQNLDSLRDQVNREAAEQASASDAAKNKAGSYWSSFFSKTDEAKEKAAEKARDVAQAAADKAEEERKRAVVQKDYHAEKSVEKNQASHLTLHGVDDRDKVVKTEFVTTDVHHDDNVLRGGATRAGLLAGAFVATVASLVL